MGPRVIAAIVSATLFAGVAHAEPTAEHSSEDEGLPDISYLWDGGALPFVWGALGGRLVLDHFTTPRATPLFFSASEGGASKPDWTIPGWAVTATGGLLAAGMIAGGDDSRWYHVKGLAESLSTGVLLTAGLKVTFGRHRPDWDPATNAPDDRRSFASGHATQAFAIATYAALYLRHHVFDSHRNGNEWPAYEIGTYALLFGGATALAAERVVHNQHHWSDVAVGGALGAVTSYLFFRYQESRFQDHKRNKEGVMFAPMVTKESVGLSLSFNW